MSVTNIMHAWACLRFCDSACVSYERYNINEQTAIGNHLTVVGSICLKRGGVSISNALFSSSCDEITAADRDLRCSVL